MKEYQVSAGDFEFTLESPDLDAIRVKEGVFHILKNQQSYHAEVLSANFATKSLSIAVNGTPYQVAIKDHFDQLVKQLGLAAASHQKVNDVKAPMPGLVLTVEVEEGQAVKKGEALLILEAMKMENVLKSMGDGVVKAIRVSQGTAVDKGELLIEMEQI